MKPYRMPPPKCRECGKLFQFPGQPAVDHGWERVGEYPPVWLCPEHATPAPVPKTIRRPRAPWDPEYKSE